MITVFIFLLGSLATFRLAHLFAKEQGPGAIFSKIRGLSKAGSLWREGLTCVLCESLWWSALIVGYLWYCGLVMPKVVPLYWLSMSSVAIIIHINWMK